MYWWHDVKQHQNGKGPKYSPCNKQSTTIILIGDVSKCILIISFLYVFFVCHHSVSCTQCCPCSFLICLLCLSSFCVMYPMLLVFILIFFALFVFILCRVPNVVCVHSYLFCFVCFHSVSCTQCCACSFLIFLLCLKHLIVTTGHCSVWLDGCHSQPSPVLKQHLLPKSVNKNS